MANVCARYGLTTEMYGIFGMRKNTPRQRAQAMTLNASSNARARSIGMSVIQRISDFTRTRPNVAEVPLPDKMRRGKKVNYSIT